MTSLQTAAAYLTDFADQAVILPSAVLVAIGLALSGWRRGALAWSIATCVTLAAVFVLKIGFGACGHLIAGGAVESPSGHTAAAGVFYGSIFAFVTERAVGRTALTFAVIVVVVAVVGLSRIVLGAHTLGEVGIGAAVGLLAALAMIRGAGEPPPARARLAVILLPVLAAIVLLHGMRLPAEAAIRAWDWQVWPFPACRRM